MPADFPEIKRGGAGELEGQGYLRNYREFYGIFFYLILSYHSYYNMNSNLIILTIYLYNIYLHYVLLNIFKLVLYVPMLLKRISFQIRF